MNKTAVRLPAVLLRYWLLIAGLFGLAVLVVFVRGAVLHLHYPFNTFLFDPKERFSDFWLFQPRLQRFGTPAFFSHFGFASASAPFNYPPFAAMVLLFWYRLPGHPMLFYAVTVLMAALGASAFFARLLARRGIDPWVARSFALTVLLTSFPLMILLDRMNFEGICWIALGLGLVAFVRRRFWLASTLFAVAAAIKIFPAVLFALLLSRRRWREFAYGLAATAALTLASLWMIGPTVGGAWRWLAHEFYLVHLLYVYLDRPLELGFQHSLFSVIKQAIFAAGGWRGAQTVELMENVYILYQYLGALGGLLLYSTRIRKLPLLNQTIALTACALLLPWWSGDYTLLHLYVPWALLTLWIVDQARSGHEDRVRGALWYLAPFAVLFTPQSYLIFGYRAWGGQVKAVALVALLIASLRLPLPWKLLDGGGDLQDNLQNDLRDGLQDGLQDNDGGVRPGDDSLGDPSGADAARLT